MAAMSEPSLPRRVEALTLMNRAYLGEARQGEIVNRRAHEPLVNEKE
jgi:hypothetical protein